MVFLSYLFNDQLIQYVEVENQPLAQKLCEVCICRLRRCRGSLREVFNCEVIPFTTAILDTITDAHPYRLLDGPEQQHSSNCYLSTDRQSRWIRGVSHEVHAVTKVLLSHGSSSAVASLRLKPGAIPGLELVEDAAHMTAFKAHEVADQIASYPINLLKETLTVPNLRLSQSSAVGYRRRDLLLGQRE